MGTLLDAIDQESLDNQREVVKEEKRQRYDNVRTATRCELLNALTFPADHPYGHTTIGSMDDLDAATLDDVQRFFRTHYAPNNAVLSIVGDVDPRMPSPTRPPTSATWPPVPDPNGSRPSRSRR